MQIPKTLIAGLLSTFLISPPCVSLFLCLQLHTVWKHPQCQNVHCFWLYCFLLVRWSSPLYLPNFSSSYGCPLPAAVIDSSRQIQLLISPHTYLPLSLTSLPTPSTLKHFLKVSVLTSMELVVPLASALIRPHSERVYNFSELL